MSLRERLQALLTRPRVRRSAEPSPALDFIERSRLVAVRIFVAPDAALSARAPPFPPAPGPRAPPRARARARPAMRFTPGRC